MFLSWSRIQLGIYFTNYTDVYMKHCMLSAFRVSVKKTPQATCADVPTSQPPSLPGDVWPARILYSSGLHDIYRLLKFLHRVINNWFNLPYTDVYLALYIGCFPSVCGKNFTGDSGRIQTHDLLLTSADVLTSRPPDRNISIYLFYTIINFTQSNIVIKVKQWSIMILRIQ